VKLNLSSLIAVCLTFAGLSAATRGDRYALILSDPPLARLVASRDELKSTALTAPRARIDAAQRRLRASLEPLGIAVLGSMETLTNAVFVQASEDQLATLRALPGVARVEKMRPIKPLLNRALGLMNVPAAWTTVGGQQTAGAGMRIGILDSGIDQTHPAFQDNGLSVPAGFPKCNVAADCSYTNRKVIVARSYVNMLVTPEDPANSRPDDLTPRDRVGHGTAEAMIAAGATVQGPAATITGVAPKAYLGNYKIFGSPGISDFTFPDVVLRALEDASSDGMNVVVLAVGQPALWGASDTGSTCFDDPGVPCDFFTDAVRQAVQLGLTIVTAAGNDGFSGHLYPLPGSIESPGNVKEVITVGATTNSHLFYSSVRLSGAGIPSSLVNAKAVFGDGPKPASPFTAPVRDVSKLDGSGLACSSLAAGSLAGTIALVQRGTCTFLAKAVNVQAAGAVGLIVVTTDEFPYQMFGLSTAGLPGVMIGVSAGSALQTFLSTHANYPATLDPTLSETVLTLPGDFDTVDYTSSYGPTPRDNAIKPDLVAVGTDLYTATQNYDPNGNFNGNLYDPTRFTTVSGTSFAAAFVAGAVALVKQVNPGFSSAQLKSAVVNTANLNISVFDDNNNLIPSRVIGRGAGKLDAGAAVQTTVEANPSTLSFGVISGSLPGAQNLTLTNSGKTAATLQLAVVQTDADSRATVSLSSSSLTLTAGGIGIVTVRMTGNVPLAGRYEGAITIQGGAVNLRVPYLYIVSDGIPYNAFALRDDGFDVIPGDSILLDVKVMDRYGAPVPNVPIRFRSTLGGGSISKGDPSTDALGIAEATAIAGSSIGDQEFAADINNPAQFTIYFDGKGRNIPHIGANGVVNTASNQAGQGLAPGSYISIYGTNLSDVTRIFATPYLPIAIGGVSVSFDIPSKNISVPGHIYFVSPGQINIQIPWELQGHTSVMMKVSIGSYSSNLYNVALNDYSPAMFEYTEAGTNRVLAAALDSKFLLIGSNHPIARGASVQLYVNGLGPVNDQPASGEPASATPLSRTVVLPKVTIGGQPGVVSFSGLAPGIVGLYQINVTVPTNIDAGVQPVIINQNGVISKTSQLVVQ
jgi:minor extracellular serine protease Vpr